MSANWVPGRGFVQKASAAAGRAANVAGQVGSGLASRAAAWDPEPLMNKVSMAAEGQIGKASDAFYAGPKHKQARQRAAATSGNTTNPQPQVGGGGGSPGGGGGDEDIKQFRDWQSRKKGYSPGLGTPGKDRVWREYSELSGIGMDYNRGAYSFKDIRPRTNGRMIAGGIIGRNNGVGIERSGSGSERNMTPDAEVQELKAADDWSDSENSFTPDTGIPTGTFDYDAWNKANPLPD